MWMSHDPSPSVLCMGYSSLANWDAYPSWFLQTRCHIPPQSLAKPSSIIWHHSWNVHQKPPIHLERWLVPLTEFPGHIFDEWTWTFIRLHSTWLPIHVRKVLSQNQWQIWYKQFCGWFRSNNDLTYLGNYDTYIFPVSFLYPSYNTHIWSIHISPSYTSPSASTTSAHDPIFSSQVAGAPAADSDSPGLRWCPCPCHASHRPRGTWSLQCPRWNHSGRPTRSPRKATTTQTTLTPWKFGCFDTLKRQELGLWQIWSMDWSIKR